MESWWVLFAVEQDILLFSITVRRGRGPQAHLTTEPATGTGRLHGSSRILLNESHKRIRVDKNKGTIRVIANGMGWRVTRNV